MVKVRSIILFLASPYVATPLSLIATALVCWGEEDTHSLPFLFFIFFALMGFALLLTQRLSTSLCMSLGTLLTISAVSHMKLDFMGMSLYAYDTYFYQRDLEIYRFLWDTYLDPIWPALAIGIVGTILFLLAWLYEARLLHARSYAAILLLLALFGLPLTYPSEADHTGYYLQGHRATSFFASLKSTAAIAGEMTLYKGLVADPSAGAYTGTQGCTAQKRPDIVIALMESAMPPSLFDLKVGPDLKRAFSPPETIRPLRTEVFGGGTWISTVGVMTSLATTEFGWARPYLPVYLQGRVHHSLPQYLKGCGYRSAVISPLTYNFVNEGAFLSSLGVDDYIDYAALKVPSKHERDNVYFNAALRYLDERHRTSDQPLLVYVMTMATHGPYRDAFLPQVAIAGAPFGNSAEADEYLRRLSLEQNDFADFISALRSAPDPHGTVVLDFGDHQPSVTPSLIARLGPNPLKHPDSRAYQTYYRVTSINVPTAQSLPSAPVLDIAYLAPTVLQAAGLPLDDVYTQLVALRDRCDGAFARCKDQNAIKRHLSRLINGGFLDLGKSTQGSAVVHNAQPPGEKRP